MDARRNSLLFFAAVWALALSATFAGFPPDWKPDGTEAPAPRPPLKAASLLSGRFGEDFERWCARKFGLRGLCIRLAHQLGWELFRTLPNPGGTTIDRGKDGWLYEHEYVRHHVRRPGMRKEDAEAFAGRMAALRDRLAERGIPLVVCLSPSKAAVYPEHLPEYAQPAAASLRNTPARDILAERLRAAGVAVVDARALFLGWKDEGTLLFPRNGTHWNAWGAQRVFDAVLAAARAQGAALPPVPETVGHEDAPPLGPDRDLSNLYNMLRYPYPEKAVPYPVLAENPAPEGRRLRIFGVGDSFSFQLADAMGRTGAVASFRLLYYNKADYRFSWAPGERPRENGSARFRLPSFDAEAFDLGEATRDCDLVVVEMNDIYARSCAWGFGP
ncbi:MAG: hypothetical protein IJS32_10530 [Kiritimatiellae bacterium]|nr:hypothetical protein [Kiritimatiellia bacterium]